MFAAVISLAQALVGSTASSNIHATSQDVTYATKMGTQSNAHVKVHVQTRTEVDTERDMNVVQLELADWKRAEEDKVHFTEREL